MRYFYRVYNCVNCENYFLKNKENAKSFLWQIFLDYYLTGDESEEDIKRAKEELDEFDSIDDVGIIYVESFED